MLRYFWIMDGVASITWCTDYEQMMPGFLIIFDQNHCPNIYSKMLTNRGVQITEQARKNLEI